MFTDDQFIGIGLLNRWYRKYSNQFISIAGIVGTGIWELIQAFIEDSPLDPRQVMYLTYDQHQVVELAAVGFHAYYIENIIYKYFKITDINTLPLLNKLYKNPEFKWKKKVKSRVDESYKLIVVFDSGLLSKENIKDLSELGLPIILLSDPILPPCEGSYLYTREPNIMLRNITSKSQDSSIIHFAHKALRNDNLIIGSYDTVNIVTKKQLNIFNFRTPDMNITMSEDLSKEINEVYRNQIMKLKDTTGIDERLIVKETLYGERLKNPDNEKIKIYLTKGLVGTISKVNKHYPLTRYIPIDFKPDFYYSSFEELYLDRYTLNTITANSRQEIPDEIFIAEYAYALPVQSTRYSHWDKVTVIVDDDYDEEIKCRLLYMAITKADQSLTIVI